MVTKSQAIAAWERSSCFQVTDVRVGEVDADVLEDLPHGGRAEGVAEPDELAMDAAVAPGRVLPHHPHGKVPDPLHDGRSPGGPVGPGPMACNPLAVPSQQRVGGDQPAGPSGTRERSRDRAEQAAVRFGQGRPLDLSSQHGELVAQNDDLKILGPVGADQLRHEQSVEHPVHQAPSFGAGQ
jgi:hypothetical protein